MPYARGHLWRQMTLTADEFLRRFLQHVLPRGFVRIRSFGLLAHHHREERLALCRRLLGATPPTNPPDVSVQDGDPSPPEDAPRCEHCGGTLFMFREIPRPRCPELVARTYNGWFCDSS